MHMSHDTKKTEYFKEQDNIYVFYPYFLIFLFIKDNIKKLGEKNNYLKFIHFYLLRLKCLSVFSPILLQFNIPYIVFDKSVKSYHCKFISASSAGRKSRTRQGRYSFLLSLRNVRNIAVFVYIFKFMCCTKSSACVKVSTLYLHICIWSGKGLEEAPNILKLDILSDQKYCWNRED